MASINVDNVDGIFLEDIPVGTRGRMGVCLTHSEWEGRVYIVQRHTNEFGIPWDEDSYFDLAYRLMALKGISKP